MCFYYTNITRKYEFLLYRKCGTLKENKNKYSDRDWETMEHFIGKVCAINDEVFATTGKRPLAYTHTYGCQQNVSDGEKIDGMLKLMGYNFTDDAQKADFILYNTCAVRENAEDRVFGNVGALKHYKLRNPNLIIALCGCMMQQEHIEEKIKKSYPFVNLVFGTHGLDVFPQLVYDAMHSKKRLFYTEQRQNSIAEGLPSERRGELKAYVPIMNGCDNFCTYCIVPYVRGRECSREPEHIVEEVKSLVTEGYKDITLLGQNVNSYGKKLGKPVNFSDLLTMLNDIDGDFRIRFMTSHPKDCTHELIDTIAKCDKVCNHIHLPVQSGSDKILKTMNRHYNKAKYLELIDYAKSKIKDVSFTSDIIVGFPGETYNDFLETIELIKKVRYESLYTFIYSKRVGTPAAKMEDVVSEDEKSKWFRELLAVQEKIGEEMFEEKIGKTLEVLVDDIGKTQEGFVTGRSEGNVIVEFKGCKEDIGKFIKVKITEALHWCLIGERI